MPRYEGTGALLRKWCGVRLFAHKHRKMTVYPGFDLSSYRTQPSAICPLSTLRLLINFFIFCRTSNTWSSFWRSGLEVCSWLVHLLGRLAGHTGSRLLSLQPTQTTVKCCQVCPPARAGSCIPSCCLSASPAAMQMFTVDWVLVFLMPLLSPLIQPLQLDATFKNANLPVSLFHLKLVVHSIPIFPAPSPSATLLKHIRSMPSQAIPSVRTASLPPSSCPSGQLILCVKNHCIHGGNADAIHSLAWYPLRPAHCVPGSTQGTFHTQTLFKLYIKPMR